MRYTLKEAGLQKLALTNRKYIRGLKDWISNHTIVKSEENKKIQKVDVPAVNGRKMLLPREVSLYRVYREKSAEVIVVISNEPMKKKKLKLEDSQVYEGLNIKLFQMLYGIAI